MIDPFLAAAGPVPARGREALLRQLALLGVAAATNGGGRARTGMAATLLALDAPAEAGALLASGDAEPWAVWWGVLAAGQAGGPSALAGVLGAALERDPGDGPDAREVRRRLGDLADEAAALGCLVPGHPEGGEDRARFGVDGNRVRPERRMLLVGRSSAAYLVDPEWDALSLVRLAPSDGPSGGNRAHLTLAEVIEAARRGDAGSGRIVPPDVPPQLDPDHMIEALREDPDVRDRRLISLANEVRDERDRLRGERVELEEERARVRDERERLRRLAPVLQAESAAVRPKSVAEAAEILGVSERAGASEVERAYRSAIAGCHPDRVDGLHPGIRRRAQDLTIALNTARDLLLGRDRPARAANR